MKRDKKNPLGRPLARPGDPLVVGNMVIQPERIVEEIEIDEPVITAKTFKPKARKTISELPVPPIQMHAIACVFLYSVFGVTEREVADTLKISLGEVKAIKGWPAYNECFNAVVNEFISANGELLAGRLAAYSQSALTNVADIAANGKKEETKLKANVDLLNRGGVGVQNGITISKSSGGLRITVIEADAAANAEIGL